MVQVVVNFLSVDRSLSTVTVLCVLESLLTAYSFRITSVKSTLNLDKLHTFEYYQFRGGSRIFPGGVGRHWEPGHSFVCRYVCSFVSRSALHLLLSSYYGSSRCKHNTHSSAVSRGKVVFASMKLQTSSMASKLVQ